VLDNTATVWTDGVASYLQGSEFISDSFLLAGWNKNRFYGSNFTGKFIYGALLEMIPLLRYFKSTSRR